MKKVILFTFLLIAGWATAQDKEGLKKSEQLVFFGVDFSAAKVYGAEETDSQFRDAFIGINRLFQSEPKKYDVSEAFGKETKLHLKGVQDRIDQIKRGDLEIDHNNYTLGDEEVAKVVRGLDTGDSQGYGAVLIANLLDKGKASATYDVVLFDIQSRKILYDEKETNKARGFGLRNYWAATVYKTLKQTAKKDLYK